MFIRDGLTGEGVQEGAGGGEGLARSGAWGSIFHDKTTNIRDSNLSK